jgi:hypothetical protein
MIVGRGIRIAVGLVVVALALGIGALVLLPQLQRFGHDLGRLSDSRNGFAGTLAQQLFPRTHAPTPMRGRAHAHAHAQASPAARSAPHPGERTPTTPWAAVFAMLAAVLGLVPASAASRLYFRSRRRYLPYRILSNPADQPRPEALVAALAPMGEVVAEPAAKRLWRGQPVFGVQLDYDPREGGEVIPLLYCERRHVRALDAALRQAYPNARVGVEFSRPYEPVERPPWTPGAVWRLRKSRDPIYRLFNDEKERELGPPLETAGGLLHGLGEGAITRVAGQFASVRIMVLPSNTTASYLRERHRREERRSRIAEQLARGQHAPPSSIDSQQARQSAELDEHAMYRLEVQIAADDEETCKRLSRALTRYPGLNTLNRRNMLVRKWLYRRRWASFQPPLVMRGPRKVVSATELGYLLRLPALGMTAPMARIREPRLAAGHRASREIERGTPIPQISTCASTPDTTTGERPVTPQRQTSRQPTPSQRTRVLVAEESG